MHRFRDIAFDRSKIAISGIFSPRRTAFPGTISVKFFTEVERMAKVQNGVETLQKIVIGCVWRMKVTDDRHTAIILLLFYSFVPPSYTNLENIYKQVEIFLQFGVIFN